MKKITPALLFLLLAIEAMFVTGCAHTMNGASQDYHSAEDHVERAVK
jgi:predicted small secreted protein